MIQNLKRMGKMERAPHPRPTLVPPPPRSPPIISYRFLQNISTQIQIWILISLCFFYI